MLDHLLGDAAEKGVADDVPPVTTHDDQTGADPSRLFHDRGVGASEFRCGRTGDPSFTHLEGGTFQSFGHSGEGTFEYQGNREEVPRRGFGASLRLTRSSAVGDA
jgi:hypothetical protein